MLRRNVIRQIIVIELAMLCLFGFGYMGVFNSYIRLENQQISTDIQRVKSALEGELANLNSFNKSWANSNILYYAFNDETPNQHFMQDMLMTYIVGVFNVDRSAVFDKEGKFRKAHQLNLETGTAIKVSKDQTAFSDFQNILNAVNNNHTKSVLGFYVDKESNIRLVSAEPIVRKNQPENIFGNLIASSRFDKKALARLANVVLQEVNIQSLAKFSENKDAEIALQLLSTTKEEFVNIPKKNDTIDSFSYLRDIQGRNSLILSVHSRRDVITQAKENIFAGSLGLLIFFMILAAYIIILLDKKILRRLKILSQDVTELDRKELSGKSLPVLGNDEISSLTKAFNRLLSSLEQSHRDIKHEKDKAETTLASIGEAVIACDLDGKIQYLNKTAEQLTKSENKNNIGQNITSIFSPLSEGGDSDKDSIAKLCVDKKSNVQRGKFNRLVYSESEEIIVESKANPIFDHDGNIKGAVIVFRDISEAKSLQQNLVYQASHDSLTGLCNRAEFERKIDEIIKTTLLEKHQNHLLFIDLDRFKLVNDSCGHLAGDKVLRDISLLMKTIIRQSDTIARIGGDEFGVILHDCPFEKAFGIAEKLRIKVAGFRFFSNEKSFTFGASIGLINIDDHVHDTNAGILSLADKACMAAKNTGRNRVHVFKNTDEHVTEQRNQTLWVNRITEALEHNQFTLFYQKIIPSEQNKNRKIRAEILLRMLDKTGGVIAPGVFLPAAERYGLMQQIDIWVIENFFQWHIDNAETLDNFDSFSINLSGQSLSDEKFLEQLNAYANSPQINAKTISFEITETAAIQNITNTIATFSKLRKKGFSFWLDDFGAGMSSFSYLKHLPIDGLKIDGIFIRNIDNQPFDYSMVRSINELAHLMGVTTTAEFIETERVSALVSGLGVDYLQGYHIHRPEPLSTLIS